jgi:hypothetical protein
MMRRKSFIAAWLLLPVWLAVIANISVDAAFDGSASADNQAAAAEHGKNGSSKDIPPFKHAVHHLIRRALVPGGVDSKSSPLTGVSTVALAGLQVNLTPAEGVKIPEDFFQSRHFYLRNAGEPRAPSPTSSVS